VIDFNKDSSLEENDYDLQAEPYAEVQATIPKEIESLFNNSIIKSMDLDP
jgi:hypothetical protein